MTNIQRIEKKHIQKRRTRLTIWVVLVAIILLSLGAQANTPKEEDKIHYTTLIVSEGDTLWDLAEDINQLYYSNEFDLNDLVKHMREVNQLNSVVINVGQELSVAMDLPEEE